MATVAPLRHAVETTNELHPAFPALYFVHLLRKLMLRAFPHASTLTVIHKTEKVQSFRQWAHSLIWFYRQTYLACLIVYLVAYLPEHPLVTMQYYYVVAVTVIVAHMVFLLQHVVECRQKDIAVALAAPKSY